MDKVNNLLNSGICFTVFFKGLKYNSYSKIIDVKAISAGHCIQLMLNQDQCYLYHSHGFLSGLQSERSQCSVQSSDCVTMWRHWVSGPYALLCVTQTSNCKPQHLMHTFAQKFQMTNQARQVYVVSLKPVQTTKEKHILLWWRTVSLLSK